MVNTRIICLNANALGYQKHAADSELMSNNKTVIIIH